MDSIIKAHQDKVETIFSIAPIIPVVAIADTADAVDIAAAFKSAGINNIEIVLRNDQGMKAIESIAASNIDIHVGAGTVLAADEVAKLKSIGTEYIISPGFSDDIHNECLKNDIPYIPGAITPTEVQARREQGYRHLKFFPAEAMGGLNILKSYAGVFRDVKFCATGSIKAHNAQSYLDQKNVIAIGTSALMTPEIQKDKNWDKIAETVKKLS